MRTITCVQFWMALQTCPSYAAFGQCNTSVVLFMYLRFCLTKYFLPFTCYFTFWLFLSLKLHECAFSFASPAECRRCSPSVVSCRLCLGSAAACCALLNNNIEGKCILSGRFSLICWDANRCGTGMSWSHHSTPAFPGTHLSVLPRLMKLPASGHSPKHLRYFCMLIFKEITILLLLLDL